MLGGSSFFFRVLGVLCCAVSPKRALPRIWRFEGRYYDRDCGAVKALLSELIYLVEAFWERQGVSQLARRPIPAS